MLCAFIVMKCGGFSQITDLEDYLSNDFITAHCCGLNIIKALPFYWIFGYFVKRIDNARFSRNSCGLKRLSFTIRTYWMHPI